MGRNATKRRLVVLHIHEWASLCSRATSRQAHGRSGPLAPLYLHARLSITPADAPKKRACAIIGRKLVRRFSLILVHMRPTDARSGFDPDQTCFDCQMSCSQTKATAKILLLQEICKPLKFFQTGLNQFDSPRWDFPHYNFTY